MRWAGIVALGLVAAMFALSAQPAEGGGEALMGTITVDTPDVLVTIYPSNETQVEITGYGMLEEQNGVIVPLETSLRFYLGGDSQWAATITPASTIDGIQVDHTYEFRVIVTIPPGTTAGESETYTVNGLFEDRLETYEASAGFVIRTAVVDTGNNNGGGLNNTATSPESDDGQHTVLIVFIIGLLVILGAGGFWAYKNVELVKDPNGDRRIYLREKDTGRPFKKEPPKGT
ncbi:MAG: hypothetical protein KAH57_04855 [Thermoplasmata archaeon]|nr:hypothetical protein [Thermoplasmata archaeon]